MLLDSTVLIAYLNGPAIEPTYSVAEYIIEHMLAKGRNEAIFSAVSMMELLVQPIRVGGPVVGHVHDFLTHTVGLRFEPIDMPIAQEAASLRATHRFKTPDALVIATGVVHQVSHLVTNDEQWRTKLAPLKNRFQVTMPKDYL